MSDDRLDELDHKLIEILGRDARVSNRQIAADLGVTEGTIRARIRRLQDARLIQFSVVTDLRLAGSPNLALMGIHADPAKVTTLAAELAKMPNIGAVVVLLGRYNLLATSLATSLEEFNHLVRTKILPLPGVRSVDTSTSVQTLKYDYRMARITQRAKPRARSKSQAQPSTAGRAKAPAGKRGRPR
jgi:Lrp/AsnC family transcriptional regulator for asnA, asnC and gidA